MRKTVLITDLDNTLFDWVEVWSQSFSAMLAVLLEQTGADPVSLKNEIQEVHKRHGTSEYAFLLEEVPTLKAFAKGEPVTEVFEEAIRSFRVARKKSLMLYPRVKETLQILKESQVRVVAYTESMAFYTGFRIRNLELDGLIDILFSPKDHDLPEGLSPEDIRRYPASYYEFRHTAHRHTPPNELKPNPQLLKDIISLIEAKPTECVYVGDSLHRDVLMAQRAEVDHAWAKYGVAHKKPEYRLLEEVTHWDEERKEAEKRLKEVDVAPKITLHSSFSEIRKHFKFGVL